MDDKEKHSAGATVTHKSPFDSLPTPKNDQPIDQEIRNRFVIPIYMSLLGLNQYQQKLEDETAQIIDQVDEKLVAKLLGDFNWRTRSVGAYFSAIKSYTGFQTDIGNHLLKSEVCSAGETYCLALTVFNNQISIDYLNKYLDYYLTQKQLYFDQGQAIGALAYLDKTNGTNEMDKHLSKWNEFVVDKPNWGIEHSIEWFEKNVNVLKEIINKLNGNIRS